MSDHSGIEQNCQETSSVTALHEYLKTPTFNENLPFHSGFLPPVSTIAYTRIKNNELALVCTRLVFFILKNLSASL